MKMQMLSILNTNNPTIAGDNTAIFFFTAADWYCRTAQFFVIHEKYIPVKRHIRLESVLSVALLDATKFC